MIVILIILELFEVWWQKAETLLGVLERCYEYYRKSIFLLFLMHPTFYYILFVVLFRELLNGWIVTILLLKSMDILFKLAMIKIVFLQNRGDETLGSLLYEPLSPWIFLMGLSLYPLLFFYALI